MAFNLVDVITNQVSNSIVKQIGSVLGASESQTQTAVSGAIPALLGGLLGQSSSPAGAKGIMSTLEGLDTNILDNFGNMIGSSKQNDLLKLGSSLLGSSMGGDNLSSMAGALAGFSGLNKAASSSLLGMLAPLALGMLKKQLLGSGGLNVDNLTSMLLGQKQNITAAMPTGLGDRLASSGLPGMGDLLSGLGTSAAAVTNAVNNTAAAATKTASTAASSAQRAATTTSHAVADKTVAASNSLSKYLIPGLIALALIALGLTLFNRSKPVVPDASQAVERATEAAAADIAAATDAATNAVANAADATTTAAGNAANAVGEAVTAAGDAANSAVDGTLNAFAGLDDLVIGDLNLGQELGGAFGSISGLLSGITDTATAEAALPALTEAGNKLESLASNLGDLSEAQRNTVADAATNGMAGIQGILNTLDNIPGVSAIIQPVVDQIMGIIAQFIS